MNAPSTPLCAPSNAGKRLTNRLIPMLIGPLMAVLSGTLLTPMPASAGTTIYRCGNEYRQTPCDDGQALTLKDRVREEDRRAAQSRIDATQAAADSLRAERLQREAEQQRALGRELKAQQSAERAQALQVAKAQREADAQALARSRALDRAARPPRQPTESQDPKGTQNGPTPPAPPARSWGNAPTR